MSAATGVSDNVGKLNESPKIDPQPVVKGNSKCDKDLAIKITLIAVAVIGATLAALAALALVGVPFAVTAMGAIGAKSVAALCSVGAIGLAISLGAGLFLCYHKKTAEKPVKDETLNTEESAGEAAKGRRSRQGGIGPVTMQRVLGENVESKTSGKENPKMPVKVQQKVQQTAIATGAIKGDSSGAPAEVTV